ncbi:MAG: hypothetical protein WD359_02580, partial [Dehalococcoidia bacterium]
MTRDGSVKVHVIGIAGSGKTTLARWIGDTFAVVAHDLDFVVYDVEKGERPHDEIVARVDEIRSLPGWVTEGAYHDAWLRPLLDEADAIAWLDVPLRACLARIVKRHVRAELARTNVHRGWRRLASFLVYIRRTARRQRAETVQLLA